MVWGSWYFSSWFLLFSVLIFFFMLRDGSSVICCMCVIYKCMGFFKCILFLCYDYYCSVVGLFGLSQLFPFSF